MLVSEIRFYWIFNGNKSNNRLLTGGVDLGSLYNSFLRVLSTTCW